MILAGFLLLVLLVLGGISSMHMGWKKETIICWVLVVLLCMWLYPALAGN